MTTIAGQLNNFNNLLYTTKRNTAANYLEHKAGRVPLDLSYKGDAALYEVLNCDTAQLNGKYGDIKYKPKALKSRPYYGYDAGFDPTILNCTRLKYTDVSGFLIPPVSLPKNKNDINKTTRPLTPIGIIH